MQDGFFAVVEVEVLKFNVSIGSMEHFRLRGFRHGIFRGEQLEDAFAGGAGLVQLVVQPRERFDGRVNLHDGKNKHKEVR